MKLLVTILLIFAVCTSCGGIKYHNSENADSNSAPATTVKTYTRPQVHPQDTEQSQSKSVEVALPAVEAQPEAASTTTTTSTTYYIPLSSVAYKEVSTSLVGSDSVVDKLLTFGAEHIVKIVNAKYPLSELSFAVSKVNHLYAKTLDDLIDYKFDVQLMNSKGYYINTVFCATYSKSTGKMKMVSYNWHSGQSSSAPQVETTQAETITETETVTVVDGGSSSNVVEAPNVLPEETAQPVPEVETTVVVVESAQPAAEVCDEENPQPEVVETVEQTPQPVVVEAVEQSPQPEVVEPVEQSPPSTSTTTTTTTTYIPLSSVAYKEVSTSLVGSDSLVDKLLSFGAEHIIKVANAKSPLGDLSFTVTTVRHVYVKTLEDLTDYKFDVQLTNKEGYYVNTVFCVTYSSSTGEMKVVSYKWKSGYNAPAAETATETTTETITVVEGGSSSNVVEAPNVLPEEVAQPAPEVETVIVVENPQPASQTEVCDEESAQPVAETKQAETEQAPQSESATTTTTTTTYIPLSSVAYKEVSTSLVGSDSQVDKLLSFGAEHIIKVANAKAPLGDLSFTVTSVRHVYVKTLGDLIDYKFDVRLNNTEGSYVDTVFCVTYSSSTQEMKVISYKWKSARWTPGSQTSTTTETVTVIKAQPSNNVVQAPNILAPEVGTTVVLVEQPSHPAKETEDCDTGKAK